MTRYRVSRFVSKIEYDDTVVLCHGPAMQRVTVARDLGDALELFRAGATIDDLAEACDSADTANRLAQLFLRHALVVPDGTDEDALWVERLGLARPAPAGRPAF